MAKRTTSEYELNHLAGLGWTPEAISNLSPKEINHYANEDITPAIAQEIKDYEQQAAEDEADLEDAFAQALKAKRAENRAKREAGLFNLDPLQLPAIVQ